MKSQGGELESRLLSSPRPRDLGPLLPISAPVSSHLKLTDEPTHHLYGPFWPKESVNLCLEHCLTMDNPGTLSSFMAAAVVCHWEYLMLGPLRDQRPILLFPPRQAFREPNTLTPGPTPKKPLTQKGHFTSWEAMIQAHLTGRGAEHCSANWKVRQWRPQPREDAVM